MTRKQVARPDPPIACTLEAGAADDRLAEWRCLLEDVAERETIPGGARLHFTARPGLAATVADLAQREQECCAFFTFAIGVDASGISLDVVAPDAATAIVTALLGED